MSVESGEARMGKENGQMSGTRVRTGWWGPLGGGKNIPADG